MGPYPIGGDEQCISVAAGDMLDPFASPTFIPNLRMVVEAGEASRNYFSLAGGISGNPFSKHYSDLLSMWLAGSGVTLDPDASTPEHALILNKSETPGRL